MSTSPRLVRQNSGQLNAAFSQRLLFCHLLLTPRPAFLLYVAAAFALIALTIPTLATAEISHLELGAANYSAEEGNDPKRFLTLERTTRKLIRMFGREGIIYLNDIDPSGLTLCAEHMRNWLQERGYENVRIVELPGNYTQIELPKVKTALLNHPDTSQINRRDLRRVAEFSETGLTVITGHRDLYTHNNAGFNDHEGIVDWIVDTKKRGDEYFYPDGNQDHGAVGYKHPVYRIFAESQMCNRLFSRSR